MFYIFYYSTLIKEHPSAFTQRSEVPLSAKPPGMHLAVCNSSFKFGNGEWYHRASSSGERQKGGARGAHIPPCESMQLLPAHLLPTCCSPGPKGSRARAHLARLHAASGSGLPVVLSRCPVSCSSGSTATGVSEQWAVFKVKVKGKGKKWHKIYLS